MKATFKTVTSKSRVAYLSLLNKYDPEYFHIDSNIKYKAAKAIYEEVHEIAESDPEFKQMFDDYMTALNRRKKLRTQQTKLESSAFRCAA